MSLDDFAEEINRVAVATIREDGHHAPMFFLRGPGGERRVDLFSQEDRSRELAEAAVAGNAEAVAIVFEAWAGDGGRDVLLVAALDRTADAVAFETPVPRQVDGTVEPRESRRHGIEYQVNVFDGVRAAWGLPVRRDLGFGVSAELPADWKARTADRIIELLPPSDRAAVHVSIFRRPSRAVSTGEARSMLERFPAWRDGADHVGPTERSEGADLVATGSCVDRGRRVDIAVRVGRGHALVFSFNDDGSEDELREAARSIFESMRVARLAK